MRSQACNTKVEESLPLLLPNPKAFIYSQIEETKLEFQWRSVKSLISLLSFSLFFFFGCLICMFDDFRRLYIVSNYQFAIVCGESSPSYFSFLRTLNRTVDSIKDNIAQIFASIFCSQRNKDADARYLTHVSFFLWLFGCRETSEE